MRVATLAAIAAVSLSAGAAFAQDTSIAAQSAAKVREKWRQVGGNDWQQVYFGPQTPKYKGPYKEFFTANLYAKPQENPYEPASGELIYGEVISREYDCAGQRMRVTGTIMLLKSGLREDHGQRDFVARKQIVTDDGQAMFAAACGK